MNVVNSYSARWSHCFLGHKWLTFHFVNYASQSKYLKINKITLTTTHKQNNMLLPLLSILFLKMVELKFDWLITQVVSSMTTPQQLTSILCLPYYLSIIKFYTDENIPFGWHEIFVISKHLFWLFRWIQNKSIPFLDSCPWISHSKTWPNLFT